MQPTPPVIRQSAPPGAGGVYVVPILLIAFFGFIALGAYGITSFFRLSADAGVLRDCLVEAVPGGAEKKLAVNVGPMTAGIVRLGSRFFSVPPEPRAALDSFRSCEVGIYRLEASLSNSDRAAIIANADKSMARRGWTRIVGVAQDQSLVAVYVPAKHVSMQRMKCSVMVVNDREVVLVAARANLVPLVNLARDQVDIHQHLGPLVSSLR